MFYKEQTKNLFALDDSWYLAHCISADFALGKGIAVEFNRRFGMRDKLNTTYPNYLIWYKNISKFYRAGDCILIDRVFNLVTKELYHEKPTYESIRNALISMKKKLRYLPDKSVKIAMPTIGCGLDKLEWDKVSEIIKDVFEDTDAYILVCKGGK